MIKYTKKVNYYKKDQFLYSLELEKKSFYILDDAINQLKKTNLKYYINNKDITALEEASVIYKDTEIYKRYYKTIDGDGMQKTNIKDL